MKSTLIYSAVLWVSCVSTNIYALTVLEPEYVVETWATYTESDLKRTPKSMTFGPDGNLYVSDYFTGTIWQISPDGEAQPFNTELSGPVGITRGYPPYNDQSLYVVNYKAYSFDRHPTLNQTGVYSLDLDGVAAPFSQQIQDPGAIAICQNETYDHAMFISSSSHDHILKVDALGEASRWGDWPYPASGTISSLAFDELGLYGHALFVGGAFGSDDPEISGLFALDETGQATRFCPDLVETECITFDPVGHFAHRLFTISLDAFENGLRLWQVDEQGTALLFAITERNVHRGLAFDEDGALYVAEYEDDMMVINRITGPQTCQITLEQIVSEEALALSHVKIRASGTRMITVFRGDKIIHHAPMTPDVASDSSHPPMKSPLVEGTRKYSELVLAATQVGDQAHTFMQLKRDPKSTSESVVRTAIIPSESASEVIVPSICTGTFPLGATVEVALFRGFVIAIRID